MLTYNEFVRIASTFVLEDGVWPAFLAWVQDASANGRASVKTELWLSSVKGNPTALADTRQLWMEWGYQ